MGLRRKNVPYQPWLLSSLFLHLDSERPSVSLQELRPLILRLLCCLAFGPSQKPVLILFLLQVRLASMNENEDMDENADENMK
jgi:hypothetical protein